MLSQFPGCQVSSVEADEALFNDSQRYLEKIENQAYEFHRLIKPKVTLHFQDIHNLQSLGDCTHWISFDA